MAQFNKNTHQYLENNKSLFEVVQIADEYGNIVGAANPSGMAVDAFGRARVSNPLTLFDSYNRYADSGKFNTSLSGGANTYFDDTNGLIELNIGTSSGDEVVRESTRVFAYQPGKSLQILSTFVMGEGKTGLRQRVGYFSTENGIYLEQDDNTVYFVRRSYGSGSVVDTRIAQADWNIDKMDGTGPSLLTLDITKSQILFIDVEWLGLGTVRVGFVINGKFIHVHSFHHANIVDGPYMTTACLPVRCEITNKALTSSASTFKQVCSTVISEGGYELSGRPRSIGPAPNALKTLTTAGTSYPLVSIRLKSTRLDGIVLPKDISFLPVSNTGRVKFAIVKGATITAGSWDSAGNDSSVEYNLTATGMSGGTELLNGYVGVTNQSSTTVRLADGRFTYQLERDSMAGTAVTFTLAAIGATNGDQAIGSIMWEEVT